MPEFKKPTSIKVNGVLIQYGVERDSEGRFKEAFVDISPRKVLLILGVVSAFIKSDPALQIVLDIMKSVI
jgi:hypothetical protein